MIRRIITLFRRRSAAEKRKAVLRAKLVAVAVLNVTHTKSALT